MSKEKTGKSGKSNLADIIGKVAGEEQTAQDTTDAPKDRASMLKELEEHPDFKRMSNADKEKIRNHGLQDPNADEFEAAAIAAAQEMTEMVNRQREKQGKSPISVEEFVDAAESDEDLADDDFENDDDYKEDMKRILGDDFAEEEEEEEVDPKADAIRDLKELERKLENATVVIYEQEEDVDKSAVTNVVRSNSTTYIDNMKSVLTDNGIRFKSSKKKADIKKGVLKNFIQRTTHVTTPLVNSGIWATLAGSSIPEIIFMNNLEAKSRFELEMKKLHIIKKHLVDTSVGKNMTISQFAQLIYYKDLQTLYFNMFAGTFPDPSEFPTNCEHRKCEQDIKLQVKATDLVLNAHEFTETSDYILYQNQDIKDVLNASIANREKQVIFDNKIVVSFRNPTVWDTLMMMRDVDTLQKERDISMYQEKVGYLLYINYIGIPDEDGGYYKYDTIDDILEVLVSFDERSNDEMDDSIKEYTVVNNIRYGFKAFTCPKCGKVNKEREVPMDNLLFTLSQFKEAIRQIEKMKKSGDWNESDAK